MERLHYFDGQRLVARDLELEQKYFIRVRRMLNRGLYSPGVVDGLEVSKIDPRHVKVSAGLALDPGGREVILLSDVTLSVPGRLPSSPLGGYFLVIQYGEETEPGNRSDCREGVGTTPPSKIKETPTLAWTETWPNAANCGEKGHPSDCAVVLALVVLDSSCQVKTIDPTVRQFAHSAVPGQVHPVSLEGEKDIDPYNSKKLHFQIRGGPPDAVLLYLWADSISSLLYTELGQHMHQLSTTATVPENDVASHTHSVPPATTSKDAHIVTDGVEAGTLGGGLDPGHDPLKAGVLGHTHPIRQAANPVGGISTGLTSSDTDSPDALDSILTFVQGDGAQTVGAGFGNWTGILSTFGATQVPGTSFIQMDGVHTHESGKVETAGATPGTFNTTEVISVTGGIADAGNTAPLVGSTPYQARDGVPAYSYFSDLQIKLDGTDITGLVKAKLGWTSLGDGTASHPLVSSGTGSIDLIQMGLSLGVGSHWLELRLNPASNPKLNTGGKVLYNLYVE
ncbi:MAG TPA: hypothetical protein VG015_05770 [Candidatus Dormibacteraeota bacterium]|nr:hypothetical protein [Candidatus Dormibacteraeota bacterium]